MRIRTITVGAREADVQRAAEAVEYARDQLNKAGYEVQTVRLAVSLVGSNRCGDFATIAQSVEEQAIELGFSNVSIGPQSGDRLAALPSAIAATGQLYGAAHIAGTDGTIYPDMIHAAAATIVALSQTTPMGLGNLRFAALAGVGSDTPYFPSGHHEGGLPWMAIGCEAATLAVIASRSEQPKETLTALIEQHDQAIHQALADCEAKTGIQFRGCDWSLAPHPDPEHGIGTAIEQISGVPFGEWGTMTAVRTLTSAIRAAKVTQLGFSGVMLPVLEDSVLAQRQIEQRYTLRDLLAFSAVCGTGLDTVPIPGDATVAQIAGVLSEVATLSTTLRKPLTARLLPMPGLKAGELLDFSSSNDPFLAEFFRPTKVLAF